MKGQSLLAQWKDEEALLSLPPIMSAHLGQQL